VPSDTSAEAPYPAALPRAISPASAAFTSCMKRISASAGTPGIACSTPRRSTPQMLRNLCVMRETPAA